MPPILPDMRLRPPSPKKRRPNGAVNGHQYGSKSTSRQQHSLVCKMMYAILLCSAVSFSLFLGPRMQWHDYISTTTGSAWEPLLLSGGDASSGGPNDTSQRVTTTAQTPKQQQPFKPTGNAARDAAARTLQLRQHAVPVYNYTLLDHFDQSVNRTLITLPYNTFATRRMALKRAAFERMHNPPTAFYVSPPLELFRSNGYTPPQPSQPQVAILAATRSTPKEKTAQSSLLYKHLLVSLSKTITAEERKHWHVSVWIGVDDSDRWWRQHMANIKVPSWLNVVFGIFPDQAHRIPFNEIAQTATRADYYCRVNDDSEFKSSGWLTLAVTKLQSYQPPNLGVVGPSCGQGNTDILTHDFVHRTHLDLFGTYYPPTFPNWYLDDWVSKVYGTTRTSTIETWKIKHHLSEKRYASDTIDALWLPNELEIGRERINTFLTSTGRAVESQKSPQPEMRPILQTALDVLPKDGNALVWQVDDTRSPVLHMATSGRVLFVEPKDDARRHPKKRSQFWWWWIARTRPYLEFGRYHYIAESPKAMYDKYVKGDEDLCRLQMPLFDSASLTMDWDVIVVDAPAKPGADTDDGSGPGVFQPMFMSYLMASGLSKKRPLHILVDDYERKYEKEFAAKLFPGLQRVNSDTNFAHFILNETDVWDAPNCTKPPLREFVHYPSGGELSKGQVEMILNSMPYVANLLIWGAFPDIVFWNETTMGRVVVLEDQTRQFENGTVVVDHYRAMYPDMEVYGVEYTTKNTDETAKLYSKNSLFWQELQMDLPESLSRTHWHTIVVDSPAAYDINTPGRYQSLYMSRELARGSVLSANDTAVTSIFVDDHEREHEATFSALLFDKKPVEVVPRGKKNEVRKDMAHYYMDKSDFVSAVDEVPFEPTRTTNLRGKRDFPQDGHMGWEQVEEILSALPNDGNLLFWGFKPESEFWASATTGRVVFLEDGNADPQYTKEELLFENFSAAHPNLEAYPVDFTTTNSDETINYYSKHPERWVSLEMELPNVVKGTRWNVIVVASPLGWGNLGPGRFQSLFMSKLLVKTSSIIKPGLVHVFVDDYDRPVESQLSLQMYGRDPIKVVEKGGENSNLQAHFVFGEAA